MNLHTFIHELREKLQYNIWFYVGYVFCVTILCLLFSLFVPTSRLRKWYYESTYKDSINKGIELEAEEKSIDEGVGKFLTMYRYHRIGATNPEEIDPNAPMVAFTFDDGPSANATQRILDALEANYSRATFFVVGLKTEQFPDLLQEILAHGCELGNHTLDHKNLPDLSDEEIIEQIEGVNRSVKKATGEETTVIRPPYGGYDDRVLSYMTEPVIIWELDSEDWMSRNAQSICDKVLPNVKEGDIVLMQDINDSTAEAVEIMLPNHNDQGYQIVSVSELAKYRGQELENGEVYRRFRPQQ